MAITERSFHSKRGCQWRGTIIKHDEFDFEEPVNNDFVEDQKNVANESGIGKANSLPSKQHESRGRRGSPT